MVSAFEFDRRVHCHRYAWPNDRWNEWRLPIQLLEKKARIGFHPETMRQHYVAEDEQRIADAVMSRI
jgi:hypothetical protein